MPDQLVTDEPRSCPGICMRCHEQIHEGDELEEVSFIPRWGWTMLVHVGCAQAKVEWTVSHA